MNHWPFIFAAYALALGGATLLTLWSFASMRRAEREAEALRRER